MRADDGADDVVGRPHRRGPVPERLVHGLLQGPRPRRHRHHLGAEELHPRDVRCLSPRVFLAHVHDARQAEQRARGRRGDAVHPGARLGDDPLLAETLREQRLTERVVDLVRPGVREVLALEPDRVAELLGQAARPRERRRPTHEVLRQRRQLGAEVRVVPERLPGLGELLERRDQHLGDVASAVGPEPAVRVRECGRDRHVRSSLQRSFLTARAGSSARISASPTRMADAPAPRAASTSAAAPDAALEDADAILRHAREPFERSLDIHLERLEVARVHADHRRVRGERAPEILLRMRLHERRETQVGGRLEERVELRVAERGHDQQDRVRPRRPRLDDLRGVHDEVLPEDRDRDRRPDRLQIRERAVEVPRFGEDRHGRRASGLVRAGEHARVRILRDRTGRR